MLYEKDFYSLLNALNSPFSKPELHKNKVHVFSLTTTFYDDNESCFKITCSPIIEANIAICEFVYNSVMDVARNMYTEGLHSDDKYIVSTSGFRDACERIIERYHDKLNDVALTMKLERI